MARLKDMRISSPFIFLVLFICACSNPKAESQIIESNEKEFIVPTEEEIVVVEPEFDFVDFERTMIKDRLSEKMANQEELVVHLFVPLCDNVNQGIVPVNKTLGDGFNPHSNLYWGAMYGIKTYFSRSTKWKRLYANKVSEVILERVVFEWERTGQSNVIVVADAYRGDQMKACVEGFLSAVSGKEKEDFVIGERKIGINGYADLVGFNGHNGLMDVGVEYFPNKDDIQKDVTVIACASHDYFKPHLQAAGGYPLVTTTNLLAPEAYVIENVISAWAEQKDEKAIRYAAGEAYNQFQKCGINGALRLFNTGW